MWIQVQGKELTMKYLCCALLDYAKQNNPKTVCASMLMQRYTQMPLTAS